MGQPGTQAPLEYSRETEAIAAWGSLMKTLNCPAHGALMLALILWGIPGHVFAQQGFTPPDDVAERTADIFSEGTYA